MNKSIIGIILGGGQSRRFGSPKAFEEKDGVAFYEYSVQAMGAFTKDIILVTNTNLLSRFSVNSLMHVITDIEDINGLGPLAGIYSAMDRAKADWYLVSPIDVPFIEASIFEMLLQQHQDSDTDAIVPIVNGKLQPLIAVLNYSIKEKVKEQLRIKELSMRQLFDKCRVTYFAIDKEKPFININTKDDLERYIMKEEEENA
ncbi:molybdenum cofactor guanylyltransferase [Ornithinibacillus xuwenensis]|uniref:Probable molybdenum cofactor guanylyltransferase n=1 Tax=Ornithinibacillus xuwenensis TaxID=3144668 RepID=A0ABU9XGI5_9BACI